MTVSAAPSYLTGFVATGDLSSYQYYIAQLASTAGTISISTSATSNTIGVLVNDPTAGQAAQVQVGGIAKVLAETSVGIGDAVTSSSTGRAKATTTGGDKIIGTALDASGSAGDLIRVLLGVSWMGD